jgi:hypothetical protein
MSMSLRPTPWIDNAVVDIVNDVLEFTATTVRRLVVKDGDTMGWIGPSRSTRCMLTHDVTNVSNMTRYEHRRDQSEGRSW